MRDTICVVDYYTTTPDKPGEYAARGARRAALGAACVAALLAPGTLTSQTSRPAPRAERQAIYYPGPGDEWERRAPAQVGLDARQLDEAIAFAKASEAKAPRDLEAAHYLSFGREPFGEGIGPFKARGDPTGVILRHGYIVAEWGDPHRVDMTFSVTKSFLSTTVGLALDRGLIRSVEDRVAGAMAPIELVMREPATNGESALLPFETPHNRKITWDHLLRQTSDWEGTLWGKPEWADRPSGEPSEWRTRARLEPGSAYEYNDVRVNVLALAALNVWR